MPKSVCLKVLAITVSVAIAASMTPASAFQRGALATPGKGHKRVCNGKTKAQCCEGISYCGCLYSPMGGDDNHPLACNSSPPR